MAKIINGSTIYMALANYLATNAYLNDTAQDVLCMVAKWIDEAPEVDVPKWIPVTERLPENTEKVLALSKSRFGNGYLSWLVRYNPDAGAFYDYDSEWGNIKIHNITHWMPLPEPPEEVE